MAEWTYKILKPIFNQIVIRGDKYILYTQSISFEKVGKGDCSVHFNNKELTLDQSKSIQIKRLIPKNLKTDYNAILHYSYIEHVLHTINDKIDL